MNQNARWNSEKKKDQAVIWAAGPLKMGPIGCPETSVNKYQSTLRNVAEERRSHVHRGASLEPWRRTTAIWTTLRIINILRSIYCELQNIYTVMDVSKRRAY